MLFLHDDTIYGLFLLERSATSSWAKRQTITEGRQNTISVMNIFAQNFGMHRASESKTNKSS